MKLAIAKVLGKSESSCMADFKCRLIINEFHLVSGNNKNCLGIMFLLSAVP